MRRLNTFSCAALAVTTVIAVTTGCEFGKKAAEGPPIQSLTIEMTSEAFSWHTRYPGADGLVGTEDDLRAAQVLHVPFGAEVEIRLKSNDFIYSLEVPFAKSKEIAVPDMTFATKFKADTTGAFRLPGDQLCGYSHPDLIGTLVVESPAKYRAWLARLPKQGTAP